MKILAFSDVHGDTGLIARVKERAQDCDVILCCGDIAPSYGKAMEIAEQIGSFDVQVLAIPGNFETPEDMDEVCQKMGWKSLHGVSAAIQGMKFFGCGGGNISPFNTLYELTEEQLKQLLKRFSGDENFIFVSHCPPKGFLDEVGSGDHVGSAAIRDFTEEQQPLLQFCGHIHENGGKESSIGKTKIYNVAKQVRIIEV